MAATNQPEARSREPLELDEALQSWLLDESRADLHLGYVNNDAVHTPDSVSPAITSNVALLSTPTQMLPRTLHQSPLISSSGDTGSPVNILSGICTTASSLIPEWPSPGEVSLAEHPLASGEWTGHEWPLEQQERPSSTWIPDFQVPRDPTPIYQPELSDVSSTSARHSSQASPGTSESTSFNFNSACSSIFGSPPITMMLPSQCGPLMTLRCSGMEPLYHWTANGFKICQHPSIPTPDVPCSFLTGSCLPAPTHSVDECLHESHHPDVNSPPHKLTARERRKLTKPEKCPRPGCSKRYPYKRELDRHILAKHKDAGPQPAKLRCPVPGCGKAYARSDHVTRHRKEKHGAFNAGGKG